MRTRRKLRMRQQRSRRTPRRWRRATPSPQKRPSRQQSSKSEMVDLLQDLLEVHSQALLLDTGLDVRQNHLAHGQPRKKAQRHHPSTPRLLRLQRSESRGSGAGDRGEHGPKTHLGMTGGRGRGEEGPGPGLDGDRKATHQRHGRCGHRALRPHHGQFQHGHQHRAILRVGLLPGRLRRPAAGVPLQQEV